MSLIDSAELSGSTVSGSEVTLLAQVIIVIAVIPIEMIVAVMVLGIHRLVHRRPPQSTQTRTRVETPRRGLQPYLQLKPELEDEQRRRHELHGENPAYEMDCQGEIFQMPDGTGSLILPVQRRQVTHEMSRGNGLNWELLHHDRHELRGHEHAQELESLIQSTYGPVKLEHLQQTGSPVKTKDEVIRVESAQGSDPPGQDPDPDQDKDSTRGSPMATNQQSIIQK